MTIISKLWKSRAIKFLKLLKLFRVSTVVYFYIIRIFSKGRAKTFFVVRTQELTRSTIWFDITGISSTDHGGGIQRVQREIGRQVFQADSSQMKAIYHDSDGFKEYSNPNLTRTPKDKKVEFNSGDVYLSTDLDYRFVIENERNYVNFRNKGVSIWFIIYDLLPIDYPAYFLDGISELHNRWFEIVSKFTGIIAISNTVANRCTKLLENFPKQFVQVREFKLGFNFSEALRINNRRSVFSSETESQLRFLMVGTLEPRKSYGEVLEIFTELWSEGINHQLTIVGKRGWKSDLLIEQIENHQNYGGLLNWKQNVSDEELINFYAKSDFLLAASVDEGYGLPLIEGVQSGCQVIARDIPIFREVMGDYGLYFKQNSSSDLSSILRTASKSNQKNIDLGSCPMPNSWEQSFQDLVSKIRDSDV